jgi:hypothetical protein
LTAPELPRIKLPEVITKTPSANQRFYKWTDSDGNVHYSDQPPEPGVQSETVTVNPNTNVLAPLDMPKPAPQPVKRATADKSGHRPKAA